MGRRPSGNFGANRLDIWYVTWDKLNIPPMARAIHRLSAVEVEKTIERGLHADGGGLYLRVGPTLAKSWIFRFMRSGKTHDMGLGPLHTISLKQARDLARAAREAKLNGDNPIELRLAARRIRLEARVITFQMCAEAYIAGKEAGWKGTQEAINWRTTLTKPGHVAGVCETLGEVPVREITREMVLRVLKRKLPNGKTLWDTQPVMAGELRRRIEKVLAWAKAKDYRAGENPAAWKENLEHEFASPRKIRAPTPQPALRSYRDISRLYALLRQEESIGAPGAQFAALVVCRADAVAGARFDEFDLDDEGVWTVPAERMKALGKDFRVPLSAPAIALVRKQRQVHSGTYVFPGSNPQKPVIKQTILAAIQSNEWNEHLSTHGLRASFGTWARDQRKERFREDVIEMALGHKVGNATYEAYQRGDFFDHRRDIMDAWAKVVTREVVD